MRALHTSTQTMRASVSVTPVEAVEFSTLAEVTMRDGTTKRISKSTFLTNTTRQIVVRAPLEQENEVEIELVELTCFTPTGNPMADIQITFEDTADSVVSTFLFKSVTSPSIAHYSRENGWTLGV